MDDMLSDKRFAHIGRDPRFRDMQKWQRKVKLDKRFKGMFKEPRFKLKYLVDKRGRPLRTSTSEHLRRYYDVSISDSDNDDEVKTKKTSVEEEERAEKSEKQKVGRKKRTRGASVPSLRRRAEQNSDSEELPVEKASLEIKELEDPQTEVQHEEKDVSESSSEEEDIEEDAFDPSKAPEVDFARGEGALESSDDGSDSDLENGEGEFKHNWAELDGDAPVAEAVTHRLALCNMDWDRIKAADLYMLFSSFTPTGGSISSVKIYPSEYGSQKMKEEEVNGPAELTETVIGEGVTENKDTGEGAAFHREKLREYQLNRLKYYYAVIDCDTTETAIALYDNCDGSEYESSASKIDLRYIPDDMTFDQEPKSEVSSRPDVQTYHPSMFVTSALQQSTVELTWDELDKDRMETMTRVFKKDEMESMDIKDYLASDSDNGADEEDPYAGFLVEPTFGEPSAAEREAKSAKYKALLKGLRADEEDREEGKKEERKQEKDVEMEISWEPGLQEMTEKLTNRRRKSHTPWENYLEKRKEKRVKKREEETQEKVRRKEAVAPDEGAAAFSDDDLPDGIDMDDQYFREEATGSTPVDTKMRKSRSGKKRRDAEQKEEDPRQAAELSLLMMGGEEDGRKHFSLRQIQQDESASGKKKKRNKRKTLDTTSGITDDFKIDMADTRFKAIFDNPLYNIDPSVPEFKKTKALTSIIDEKLRRCETAGKRTDTSRPTAKKTKLDPANMKADEHSKLASLVKSVKSKTKLLQNRTLTKKKL